MVTACGRICMRRKRINLSQVFAGQRLGIEGIDDGIWIVNLMQYDPGYRPGAENSATLDNPFGARVSPMS